MADTDATKPDWVLKGAQSVYEGPQVVFAHMTADQQIRAKALECVVRVGQSPGDWINFEDLLEKFERYIREGK